jgi:hypothetical protein
MIRVRRLRVLVGAAYADVFRPRRPGPPRTPHEELGGRLLAVLLVSVVLDVAGTLVLVLSGRGAGHGFAWATSELLTGGSAVDFGSSFWPHYVELAFEAWAVTAIAALAGAFGAFFHRLHLESRAGVRTDSATAQAEGGVAPVSGEN